MPDDYVDRMSQFRKISLQAVDSHVFCTTDRGRVIEFGGWHVDRYKHFTLHSTRRSHSLWHDDCTYHTRRKTKNLNDLAR